MLLAPSEVAAYAPNTLFGRLRARRFGWFESFARRLPRPLRLLDIGGTNAFWERHGWTGRADVHVTLVNLKPQPQRHKNVTPIVGDATNLSSFGDRSFDVVFSNSVIEHLFTYEKQVAMAREVRRVGRAYWVQTPNYWFPIEPHFQFPGWQWLPIGLRAALIQLRRFGWRGPCRSLMEARRTVGEIRLMTWRELHHLFPEATLRAERVCGLVKSWIAAYGAREN